MTTRICQHCETENEPGTEQCVVCGRPLDNDIEATRSSAAADETHSDKEQIERWLRQLPERSKADDEGLADDDAKLPGWLQTVRAQAETLTDEEADELMDFLAELEPARSETPPEAEETEAQANMAADLPDWVAALAPEEHWPETEGDEELSQLLAEVEESEDEPLPTTGQLPDTQPLDASAELKGIPERLAGEELPDWLAEHTDDQPDQESEALPEWPGSAGREDIAPPSRPKPSEEEAELQAALFEAFGASSAMFDQGEEKAAARAEETAELEEEAGPEVEPSEPAPSEFDLVSDSELEDELERTLQSILDLPEDSTPEQNVDQWLDILEDLSATGDTDQLDQTVLDSDVEVAELPEWLLGMRPEQIGDRPAEVELGPPEESGPLAGLRSIVPAATISYRDSVERSAARMEMSQRQQQKAALLRRLTAVAPEEATAVERPSEMPLIYFRIILGLALLSVVLLGWLWPDVVAWLPWSLEPAVPEAAEQVMEAIQENSGRPVLVAFEYTPSMSGELQEVAAVLLADLAEYGSPVITVSQFAAGVPMADQTTEAVEELDSSTLGYLPGEARGLRALSTCLDQTCATLAGRELDPGMQSALANVGLIIVLSADRDSLVNWIEQVGAQSEISMVGGVTQSLGPIARPYLDSDQLTGLIEGMPVSMAYAGTAQDSEGNIAAQLVSLTLAQWLAIAVLLAGALYFGVLAPTASAVTQVAKK